MSTATVIAPSAARVSAIRLPIPRPAPVTIATLFPRSIFILVPFRQVRLQKAPRS